MRKYDDNDERKIRLERLVREWARSGLLDKTQQARIIPDVKVEVRRTNSFLRIILFGFGALIIAASVLLSAVTLGIRGDAAVGTLCLIAAVACFILAEVLVEYFTLYRFGIEEAAAAGAVALIAIAGGFFTSSMRIAGSGELPVFVGLTVGSIGAFAVYLRFGYVYAAIASMACLSAAPFQIALPEAMQRLLSASLLAGVFLVAWSKRREYGEEFPGDEHGSIQAVAWAGIYAFFNLRLLSVGWPASQPLSPISAFPLLFYWFTYGFVWTFPAIGLCLAIRDKDRPLLDVSVVLALVTLITNKPYLGLTRQTWDPIAFGIVLIATALLLRRWLSTGERNGFTADRLLSSDKRRLSMAGTASAALHTISHVPSGPSSADTLQSGGGRSGGAGASGSF